MLAAESLKRLGYTVLQAGNGPEALAVADQHSSKIDIVGDGRRQRVVCNMDPEPQATGAVPRLERKSVRQIFQNLVLTCNMRRCPGLYLVPNAKS